MLKVSVFDVSDMVGPIDGWLEVDGARVVGSSFLA